MGYKIQYIFLYIDVRNFVVLPLDPMFAGSNPAVGNGFLRAIKIRSTFSFGAEVKLLAPCRKVLRHVKETFEVWYEGDTS
jgi:hypothetical protein